MKFFRLTIAVLVVFLASCKDDDNGDTNNPVRINYLEATIDYGFRAFDDFVSLELDSVHNTPIRFTLRTSKKYRNNKTLSFTLYLPPDLDTGSYPITRDYLPHVFYSGDVHAFFNRYRSYDGQLNIEIYDKNRKFVQGTFEASLGPYSSPFSANDYLDFTEGKFSLYY